MSRRRLHQRQRTGAARNLYCLVMPNGTTTSYENLAHGEAVTLAKRKGAFVQRQAK